MSNMLEQLQSFMNLYKNQDAKSIVNKLLQDGKLDKAKFSQLSQQANQIINMMKMFGLK